MSPDSLLHRLQKAVDGRYAIDHELGRGGMAVVFLGRDQRLGRRVAIKVFEHEGELGARTERFLREIRVAAQLQHPNILPVFESGEGEGLVYYVMPYVAGASLRERIEREGPLPVTDAVRIAREVAEALDHAHRAGIVHRDIKPDNIMLADGVAVVADFGIARALSESGTTITDTGLALGTPIYMSPEQASAAHVDGRTDIYSLGCVLYEMLAGSPPFDGKTAQIVMARHATDAVPSLATVRVLPQGLEAIVTKALAKLPADRWPTGRALAEALSTAVTTSAHPATKRALRWPVVAAVLTVVVLAGAAVWKAAGRQFPRGPGAADSDASVAVLPLIYSGDSANAALASLIRDEVVNGLVNVRELRVPDIASHKPIDPHDDPREAGRALGVSTVLTATITMIRGRVRVEPRLISVADGVIRWQDHFDGEVTAPQDLFNIADSTALRIVNELVPRLSREKRLRVTRGVRTRNPQALKLFAEARALSESRGGAARPQRVELLRKAIALDSNYADAWAELADATDIYAVNAAQSPADAAVATRQLIDRAIELDSANATAFELRGRYKWFDDWDWDGAERDVRRAMALAEGSGSGYEQFCWLLELTGRPDSALVYARRLLAIDSLNGNAWINLGHRYLAIGRVDSALVAAREAKRLGSADWMSLAMYANLEAGNIAESNRLADSVFALWAGSLGENPAINAVMVDYWVRAGNRARAQMHFDSLERAARKQRVSLGFLSIARTRMGEREGAIQAVLQAAKERDRALPVAFAAVYWQLKDDPRIEEVRRKVYRNRTPIRMKWH